MLAQRGVIRNVARAQQINCFKDLIRQRNITPTDIDGLLDYGGKAFVYLEGKLKGKNTEIGQRCALESVTKSHWQAGHPCMAIIYEHDIPVTERIPVAYMWIRMLFTMKPILNLTGQPYNGSHWYFPLYQATKVLTAIEIFEKQFNVFN